MKLYLLICDGSDGSFSIQYCLDESLIDRLSDLDAEGKLDYDDVGCAGGSFGFRTINVPDGSTAESLGISESYFLTPEEVAELEGDDD